VFGIGVPYIALLVWLHLRYLIPLAGKERYKSRAYLIRIIPIVFLLSLIAGSISMVVTGSDEFAGVFVIYFFLTIPILLPLIWYISKNKQEKDTLQTALGSSQANLSFLRSQINPHFLFNALNTLYGTALQENAERTGEGIQKLGDMMRFMLHENTQDKISLAREVDYLNNYIDLQKLRTATSPNIVIQTNIEAQLNRLDISPMLLIPFVENAFKHGISLQHPSFINISLHTKENILYFDVNNSVHTKSEYDPEKMKSGIGLQNVKQRLALLYPKRHELIIRESAKEFFIHLTINL
ncbi:MAG: histidine kinase, partial [Niabella sp.]